MQEMTEYVQITGVVEDVVFYNSENSFTVLDVSSGGELRHLGYASELRQTVQNKPV